jgi:paraquat-inducible protein A
MSHASTATRAGLTRCGSCEKLLRSLPLPRGGRARCPRCGTTLSHRKPGSFARTWALVIAACILYVPANLYPVMEVAGPGGSEADTILSGVQAMFAAGWYPVGVLIFFASITVPLLKLLSLIGLLISVQRRSHWRPRDRTVLYRVVEVIGRWSMLDMFVVSLTVALVQLGAVATVEPRIGATFFAAVVVLTIFAAQSFDPRLIWDAMEEKP